MHYHAYFEKSGVRVRRLMHITCNTVNQDIKHLCLFSKLAARMGAYNRGVLTNACNILQLCENELAVSYYFRLSSC